jgi:probable F420-dependent oxidoreductase
MLFGIGLPQRDGLDLRKDLTDLCLGAEGEGFSSLWVYDRLLFPANPVNGLYGVDGLPWIEAYQQAADSLAVLAAAAARTERIRLGTGVLVAALHQPLQMAKALATIDHISGGGRLVAGLGSGWSADERRAVGSDERRPGDQLDETLDVLDAAWGPDPVSYRLPHGTVNSALVRPKPLAPIPVLLGGGHGARALERVARRAQGWITVGASPQDAAGTWRQITAMASDHGRDPADMQFVCRANVVLLDQARPDDGRFPFVGDLDQICADAVAIAAAGADELILELQLQEGFPRDAEAMLKQALTIRERALNQGVK